MMPFPPGKLGEAVINKYFPAEQWEKEICIYTGDIKQISEYTGLNFNEVYNLSYSLFLLYRKDSFIHNMNQTEEGRKILKDLWRLQQTEADTQKLHKYKEEGRF